MKVVVVGCGRVGGDLAYRLFQRGHHVIVVDQSPVAFQNLPEDFRGRFVEGNALNQDVLHRAGIEDADAIAAVTSSDPLNAVIGFLAKSEYHIPSVAVRNYDSRWRPLHEMFGLQMVSPASWGAQRIEELIYGSEAHTVFSSGNGEVELYEFIIGQRLAGKRLADLKLSEECIPVSITHAGRSNLPEAASLLQEGDVVLVAATLEGSQQLQKLLEASNGHLPHLAEKKNE